MKKQTWAKYANGPCLPHACIHRNIPLVFAVETCVFRVFRDRAAQALFVARNCTRAPAARVLELRLSKHVEKVLGLVLFAATITK